MKKRGKFFENKGVEFFKKKGYLVFGQNVRIGRREVDLLLIDRENQVSVLVEVKYRKNFFPQLSLIQKRNLIEFGLLLSELGPELPVKWRVDFLFFYKEEVFHMENVYLDF